MKDGNSSTESKNQSITEEVGANALRKGFFSKRGLIRHPREFHSLYEKYLLLSKDDPLLTANFLKICYDFTNAPTEARLQALVKEIKDLSDMQRSELIPEKTRAQLEELLSYSLEGISHIVRNQIMTDEVVVSQIGSGPLGGLLDTCQGISRSLPQPVDNRPQFL